MDWLGNLGFALVAASFLVKDIMLLRVLSVIANIVLIIFNYYAPAEPLWVVIWWSVIFLLINLVQIGLLFKERSGVHFSEEEKELHETLFRNFSGVELMKLLRVGQWMNAESKTVLLREGEACNQLVLLYHGSATVKVADKRIAQVNDGAFIGDMEFLTQKPASETVITDSAVRYLAWSTDELRSLFARNPGLYLNVQALFSMDLARKLEDAEHPQN